MKPAEGIDMRAEQAARNPHSDPSLYRAWQRGFEGKQPWCYPPCSEYMGAWRDGRKVRAEVLAKGGEK